MARLYGLPGWPRIGLVLLGAAGPVAAKHPGVPATPQSLGFAQMYKCADDDVVGVLGDTGTPKACLEACRAHARARACWWLDGTGGFRRSCRICLNKPATKMIWPNDWSIPLGNDAV